MNINIRHATILALGSALSCRDKVNEIYGNNELYYYERYKSSLMQDDLLKETHPASDLECINKLIGIFEDAYHRDSFENIEAIIKIFNPRVFKFIKNKTIVNVDEFLMKEFFENKYKKKVGEGLFFDESINEIDIYQASIVLIYLAKLNELNLAGLYVEQTILYFDSKFEKLLSKAISEQPNPINDIVAEIRDLLPFSDEFIKRQTNIGTMLDNLVEYKVENELIRRFGEEIAVKGYEQDKYNLVRKKIFRLDFYRYLGIFSLAGSLFDIDMELFTYTVPFNVEIYNKILYSCVRAYKTDKLPASEIPMLFISKLFLYTLSYHYNKLKHQYIHSQKEKYFEDITDLKASLDKKYNDLLIKEKSLYESVIEAEKGKSEAEERLRQAEAEIRALQKRYSNLEKEAAKNKGIIDNYAHENEMLMEFLDIAQNEVEPELEFEEIIDYIKNRKIAIIGGNQSTLKQLKQNVKNIVIFEKNTSNILAIHSCEVIFINFQWLKHSLSYKVWSEAKKSDIPIHYLSGTNFKQVVTQIYDYLKRS